MIMVAAGNPGSKTTYQSNDIAFTVIGSPDPEDVRKSVIDVTSVSADRLQIAVASVVARAIHREKELSIELDDAVRVIGFSLEVDKLKGKGDELLDTCGRRWVLHHGDPIGGQDRIVGCLRLVDQRRIVLFEGVESPNSRQWEMIDTGE